MQSSPVPIVQDLVLVGGGHTHVAVLKSLGMKPVPGLRVTLVCRDILTPYSGMLPGYVAGHYSHDACHIDLGPLSAYCGARFIHDEAVGLDPDARRIILKDRPPLAYDLVSINIGSAPQLSGVKGAEKFTTPVKPISGFTARWDALLERVKSGDKPLRIGVVGAGAGGVELILAIQHRLDHLDRARGGEHQKISYHLFHGGGRILATHPARLAAKFTEILDRRGINLHLNCRIKEARAGRLITEADEEFVLDEVLWTTRAAAQSWLREAGLAVDGESFVLVDDTLQSTSHPGVFAVGDIAHMVHHPREKAGVFAVRQSPPLTRNIRLAAQGKTPKAFKPQKTFLTLISSGDKYAVGSKGPLTIAGDWVWRWKDHIDRKFMTRFQQLPAMPAPPVPPGAALGTAAAFEPMKCGGCGSKIGADVLAGALAGLDQPDRDDVLIGLGAPDDAAVLSVPAGMVQVQSVDHFRAFITDPRIFAEIAMVHALGDIRAMGAAPQAALAMVTLPPMSPDKQREALAEIMAAAAGVLNRAGGLIVGGHTAEGPELALGFSLTGLVLPEKLLRKSGLKTGQTLILTKALGTGVLMAAHMQGKAPGPHIEAALSAMRQDSGNTAGILIDHGATAMTDVTGFGLVGHLGEMLRASGLPAEINASAVPFLAGAQALSDAGFASTLLPGNLASGGSLVAGSKAGRTHPLLFDPQTSGGLLAGIPANKADACLGELLDAGCRAAAIVGTVGAPGQSGGPVIEIS